MLATTQLSGATISTTCSRAAPSWSMGIIDVEAAVVGDELPVEAAAAERRGQNRRIVGFWAPKAREHQNQSVSHRHR